MFECYCQCDLNDEVVLLSFVVRLALKPTDSVLVKFVT